jgi:hypothetical protein
MVVKGGIDLAIRVGDNLTSAAGGKVVLQTRPAGVSTCTPQESQEPNKQKLRARRACNIGAYMGRW